MKPAIDVNFTYEWDREDLEDTILLDVSATVSAYYPAVHYLRNGDPGYPAEGGEVEDMVVTLPNGTELSPIPDTLYEDLEDLAAEKADR